MTTTALLAGGTGDLGHRILTQLLAHDVRVRLLTRPGSRSAAAPRPDEQDQVEVVVADYADHAALTAAASGADVVVSAVSGVRPVIIDAQRALLAAAVAAGVPRFIPSDFSADYRRITPGTNRNFELRREFAAHVDSAPVRATSVLNGMFADLLTGEAPMVLFARRKVLYWSSADQVLDFTTKDDVARTTAAVVLDRDTPRVVEVAGSRTSARGIAATLTELTGTPFTLQWAGTTGSLSAMSKVARRLSKTPDATFPAWQGMQYFVSMFSGQAQLLHVDDSRYDTGRCTSVRDVLAAHLGINPSS